ncbi:MAG: NnrU protein [Gammaproteobacteria bacterium]|jgi:uncharacterized membrane protein|nr:NnrU protein [Gammaproteobacteria bacterium]
MTLLIAGVLLWSIAHLLPAVAPGLRANLVGKFGEGPYKGLFALDIVIALVLIVYGWQAALPAAVYPPPLYGSPIPSVLLLLAFVLFVASAIPNNLQRFVRHPQMTGVLCWSAGHLLTNGDSRSIVLFGGFAIWAILEVLFINKRDGDWQKPASVALLKDVVTVLIATLVFAAFAYFHASLFGVSPMPA